MSVLFVQLGLSFTKCEHTTDTNTIGSSYGGCSSMANVWVVGVRISLFALINRRIHKANAGTNRSPG